MQIGHRIHKQVGLLLKQCQWNCTEQA